MIELIQTYLIVSLIIYFIPFLLSLLTRNRTGAVFVMNLFLGWTVIGWIWALVWAVTPDNKSIEVYVKNTDTKNDTEKESEPIVDRSLLLTQLSQLHELKEKGILTEEIYEQERQEILSKFQKQNVSENITQVETQEEITSSLESYSSEYKELFEKKNWVRKNRGWIIGCAIIFIGIATLYFLLNKEKQYQNRYDINKIDLYTARGFFDQSVKVSGRIIEFNDFFVINIIGNKEINSINDTLHFDKRSVLGNSIIRYTIVGDGKDTFGETDLFIDIDAKRDILIRRYTVKDYNDTTQVIYHYKLPLNSN